MLLMATRLTPSSRPGSKPVHLRPSKPSEWEPFRETLERLYVQQQMPLRSIIEYMKDNHGFDATVKQYKNRLKLWGLQKNLTRRDAAFILRLLNQARSEGREEVVFFAGTARRRADIVKYVRRHEKLDGEYGLLSCIAGDESTPAYIQLPPANVEFGQPNTPQPSPTLPLMVSGTPIQSEATPSHPFAGPSDLNGHQSNIDTTRSTLPSLSTSSNCFTRAAFHHEARGFEFNASPADVDNIQAPGYNSNLPVWHQYGDVTGLLPLDSFAFPSSLRLKCPQAPAPTRTCSPDSARSSILRYAFLPAVLISEHLRGTSPGLWLVAQPTLQECRTLPDAYVLSKCVDILAWTQISNQIVSLAVIYLLRALLHTSGTFHSVWTIWIACVRFAQIHLEDESSEIHVWQQVLRGMGESIRELTQAEILLLTCSGLSFVVGPDEWDVSTQRLERVCGSCIQRLDTLLSNVTPSLDTISRWEQHKVEIGQLYQHHSLEEVVRLMKERHHFAPRQRIAEWGFKKRQATSLTRGPECHE
ncbi:hypothetical protein CLCR_00425 [Cladophialophora carrionii]|uniref:Clr5 domain-containing protein n=1 Tax=Cladophialophora carrionii TaxID=86049 RepID=A0A1C1CBR5_9EURO|nr:hypothetical protein CLCR_00425 [Cladophialophora carrionii]